MSVTELSEKVGITMANTLYSKKLEKQKPSVFLPSKKSAEVLECQPGDLLTYQK